MKTGTRVRMTEEFKRFLRGACGQAGRHLGPFDPGNSDAGDDGGDCWGCSGQHVDEFGECVGLVEGPMFPDDPSAEDINVRWQPSGLRYGYHPNSLEVVPT